MIGTRSQKLIYLSVKFVSEKENSGRWGHRYEETGAAYCRLLWARACSSCYLSF